ncbi:MULTISPECIES: precorrin-3B C(17)-methyltransferase [Synechococcales]|uniref:precorrin-3B C(17)-methyltransferase n=1 Tax=Synechococcales TaxID=1890424 RepID=UPI0020CF3119|nr:MULTISPECIES: precorrin-3B C(17)-methyltransferase [Synechococcales]MCP9793544.1 precorrin-3B C(17)-methyltransferase [Vulcanococcus limneticus MW73D5]MCP9834777.1 precorrin-3B C(17)-methyltransferase [Cyanobium sp. La Preciosa 7G6]MCP9937599.1 precorrin-3B C(17)-methyltransferase [Cyanobium sp. Aljojuca 7A6]
MLQQLTQAGLLRTVRGPEDAAAATWLAEHWGAAEAVVAVGACGLVTRLIAPLISDKDRDPAVLVVDPQGRFVVPLLGGHAAGGDRLSQEIAALIGAAAVLTGASAARRGLPLDAFGQAWGWRRGAGDWRRLMVEAARGDHISLRQESGNTLWQTLEAADTAEASFPEALVISPNTGDGCRWHPPALWLGLGCERDTSLSLLERLVAEGLAQQGLAPEAVAGLASIDRKGDEPALLALAEQRGWPLRLFDAPTLAAVTVPHPSDAVAREMGTASVAEAAALQAAAAAGGAARLLVEKRIERAGAGERGAATLAVALAGRQWAPQRGSLQLVGSGPGPIALLSGEARQALAAATVWVGYGLYLDLLEPIRRPDQLRREGRLTEETARCAEALDLARQGLDVALISSGDSGIYGMAGLALELWLQLPVLDRPAFTVHPGLSALQLAAARAGAPLMHDFCTISLSDRLTPWEVIERRLRGAASGDFVVALYNPRSLGRPWQLGRAIELLGEGRPATTPVLLARQLGRTEEAISLHTLGTLPQEQVDMLTLVLVGNSSTRVQDGRMVTPRGYPGAALA